MKVAIVSTKDWNESECMAPARHVDYTAEDFRNTDGVSQEYTKVETIKDARYICPKLTTCAYKKCNLKQAVIDNKEIIISNLLREAHEELEKIIKSTDGRFEKIEKSLEVK
jgi:hypothetical protein